MHRMHCLLLGNYVLSVWEQVSVTIMSRMAPGLYSGIWKLSNDTSHRCCWSIAGYKNWVFECGLFTFFSIRHPPVSANFFHSFRTIPKLIPQRTRNPHNLEYVPGLHWWFGWFRLGSTIVYYVGYKYILSYTRTSNRRTPSYAARARAVSWRYLFRVRSIQLGKSKNGKPPNQ